MKYLVYLGCLMTTVAKFFFVLKWSQACFDGNPLPVTVKSGLQDMVPSLDQMGLDLLSQMLRYEPQHRITARAAVQHPYFNDIAQLFAQRILVA